MKKTCLTSLVLGFASMTSLSAYSQGEYGDNPYVFLHSPCNTFSVEAQALYLQPSGTHLHYGAEADPLPAPTPNWKIHDIKPDYHVGFEVKAKAFCHEKNTVAFVTYSHFNATDSSSTSLPSSDMIGPFFEIGPDATPYNKAKGHADFKYNALNLDYGISVNFGNSLHTTLFAGIGGVSIKETLSTFYSNPDGSVTRNIKTPSSFLGAGPQLGLDFAWNLCGGWNITGSGVTSLFVGNVKNHTTYKSISPALAELGIVPPNTQSTHGHSRTQVVPAFEGKLGIAYDFPICETYVNLEAGYEVRYYVNAIQSADIGSEVVTPPVAPDTVGVYARTFQRATGPFALAGPYFKLEVAF